MAVLMAAGFLLAAAGLAIFTRVTPTSGYLLHVLRAELVTRASGWVSPSCLEAAID